MATFETEWVIVFSVEIIVVRIRTLIHKLDNVIADPLLSEMGSIVSEHANLVSNLKMVDVSARKELQK